VRNLRGTTNTLILSLLAVACGGEPLGPDPGGGPPPPGPVGACADATEITLQPGGHVVLDPAVKAGCVRFPQAGAGGAEHVYVALGTNGRESQSGSSVSYEIRGVPAASAAVAALPEALPPAFDPTLRAFGGPKTKEAFHSLLRARERILSTASPVPAFNRGVTAVGGAVVPPTVGDPRTFKVCSTSQCTGFVDVPATARYVGPKGAIYLDNSVPLETVPGSGYTQADIDAVGGLFDDWLYPIDTTSFGRESDQDGNAVVVVLLTQQVNKLSGNCNTSGSVILGYFFGNDLLAGQNGSNNGEIFYGLVPDPGDAVCDIPVNFALRMLAPTFIHEFQHMISFNQHVLVKHGFSEDTWLNEGLSHYAEELGGRLIPDDRCAELDCFTQFAGADAGNAYDYLTSVESHFLVEPIASSGTLEERGANWLFVRWIVDQFGADGTGAGFTRALVATDKLGADNVAAATGVPFSTLAPEWQLANYLDNLGGFAPASPRLQYSSWDFRAVYASFHDQAPGSFPRAYPLVPDSTLTGAFTKQGTLRAGSGPHVRFVQAAQGPAVTVQLTDAARNAIGASPALPRVAIARIR
jgi:hypothetical protein